MKITLLLSASAGMTLLAVSSFGQGVSPDAQDVINQTAKAYRELKSLAATIETVPASGSKISVKFTFVKPSKLTAEITAGTNSFRFVADGVNMYSDVPNDAKKYLKQPGADFSTVINALARQRGMGVGLLPILLTASDAEKKMIPGMPSSVKKSADETIESESCDVIEAVVGEGEQKNLFRFAFAKTDHLLRKLTIARAADPKTAMITELYSHINLQPSVTSAVFTYVPKPGAVLTAPPKEPERFDARLKVGVVPIALTGKDLSGKPVTLDEYKGKVLLLEFWATWCGPCIAELPNVLTAYEKFHSQGFEIVGVSLDDAPDRAKLETFIKEHKMTWRQIYDGKVWSAANAVAFGVKAIPFTLLIGKDGKIAAVGARGDDLAPAIEAALKKP